MAFLEFTESSSSPSGQGMSETESFVKKHKRRSIHQVRQDQIKALRESRTSEV